MSEQSGTNLGGVGIPDSKMASDLTQLIRDTESELLGFIGDNGSR